MKHRKTTMKHTMKKYEKIETRMNSYEKERKKQ